MKKTKPTTKGKLTKSALADALGISRQALNVHLKSPDAPPIEDIAAWQILLAERGRIGSAPAELRAAIAQERLEILQETKAKIRRENQIQAGLLMEVADAKRQNASAWSFIFSELEQFQSEMPPDLAGRTAVEIGIRLHAFVERMRTEAKEKFEQAA